jgi:hypothetical protein
LSILALQGSIKESFHRSQWGYKEQSMQNQDYDVEQEERYIAGYQKVLHDYANLVDNHPEMVD